MFDFVKNFITISGSKFIILCINLTISVIVARILGPQLKGEYTVIIIFISLIYSIVNIAGLRTTIYFIAKGEFKIGEIFFSTVIYAILIGIISVIIGLTIVIFCNKLFFINIDQKYLFIALPLLPLNVFFSLLSSILFGIGKFKEFNLIHILHFSVTLLLIYIFLILLKLNLFGLLMSEVLSMGIVVMILFIILIKIVGRKNFKINVLYFKKLLSYEAKIYLTNIFIILNGRIDIFLINWFLEPSAIGYYSIATALTQKILIITQPVNTLLFKKISAEKNKLKLNEYTPLVTRTIFAGITFITLVLLLFSNHLILFFYSEIYLNSIQPFQILLFSIIFYKIWELLSNDIAARGKPMLVNITIGFAILVNFITNIYIIPVYNIIGVSYVKIASNFIAFILTFGIYCHLSDNSWKNTIFIQKNDLIIYKNIFFKLNAWFIESIFKFLKTIKK